MTDRALGEERVPAWQRVVFAPLAIYGLIIYTVLLGVLDDHAESVGEILVGSIITQVVFFAAHVFAHTLGEHPQHGFWLGMQRAVRHSLAMLYSIAPPLLVLVVCVIARVDQEVAVDSALLASTAVLAVLGYVAYSRHTRNIALRLLGALGTAALGVAIMIIEYAIH